MASGTRVKIKSTDIPQLPALIKLHDLILTKKFKSHELLQMRKGHPTFALKLSALVENCSVNLLEMKSATPETKFAKYFQYTSCLCSTTCPEEFREWVKCVKNNTSDLKKCEFLKNGVERCGQKYSKDLLKLFMYDLYRVKVWRNSKFSKTTYFHSKRRGDTPKNSAVCCATA